VMEQSTPLNMCFSIT